MNAQRERRALDLFNVAMDLAPAKRRSFIEHMCEGDPLLQQKLEAMLAADAKPTMTILEHPRIDNRRGNLDDATVQMHGLASISPIQTTVAMEQHGEKARLSGYHHKPDLNLVPDRNHGQYQSHDSIVGPGTQIGQYEIIREIGAGGMGTVYLARDTKLGRRVAVKFLQDSHPQLSERFILEARATARCSHENIVVIHDVKEYGNTPFMVLEYLKGQPLSKLVEHTMVPPGRAVQLIVPVVRALAWAHSQQIVHRDLKPANIFLTETGAIKVLDFGIAKFLFGESLEKTVQQVSATLKAVMPSDPKLTRRGALLGTLPYMSPEQWGAAEVDHRTDIWAVGIILYRMITGRHPLDPIRGERLMITALLDQPMPSAHAPGIDMPAALADIIDGCLLKYKNRRIASADKLLTALEPLLPGRRALELHTAGDDSPYAGLSAFQEDDANRFFGRTRETRTIIARLHSTALIGVVGPSGVGKSSFVRAGIIPALKESDAAWESMVIRPGRHPMAALANIIVPLVTGDSNDLSNQIAEHQSALQRLYQEPGYLGTVLRSRARSRTGKVLLFVDQFEELFTLIPDAAERMAFTACLAGMADDPFSPLRLILSIRSDFLDRIAEDRRFMSELSQNLFFLSPPDREGLREAIVRPAEMVHYRFESQAIVEEMLDNLQTTPGCLPLLQFAASKLWEARDIERCLLTADSYRRIGGVSGALATHADAVLAALTPRNQSLARTVFLQLVTPDRTRAIAAVEELCEISAQPEEVQALIQHLVDARLLVVQRSRRSGTTVEIVHESMIRSWPTLSHWLDENQDDAVFLDQLRNAARQWHGKGRSNDLLWRGDAMQEARAWYQRYKGTLPPLQAAFLNATLKLAARTARLKRFAVFGTIAFLSILVAAAAVALIEIREAEQLANKEAVAARTAKALADKKAREAVDAQKLAEQKEREAKEANELAQREKQKAIQALADLRRSRTATRQAQAETAKATKLAEKSRQENNAVKTQLERAKQAETEAEAEARAAKDNEEKASRQRNILLQEKEALRANKKRERNGAEVITELD